MVLPAGPDFAAALASRQKPNSPADLGAAREFGGGNVLQV